MSWSWQDKAVSIIMDIAASNVCVCVCVCGVDSCTDLVQQGLVSSSRPSPAILANDVVGPLLLEVSLVLLLPSTALVVV